MPALSVIIPVYNGAKYIDLLLPKLLKNLPENSEIIVVESGSSDNSQELLKKYQTSVTLISLFKNYGVSHARNLGLKRARGKFFTFLDIDDDFEPKILQKMLNKLQKSNADLCIANYDEVGDKKTTASKYNYSALKVDKRNSNPYLPLFLTDQIGPAVWDKIYRRSTLGNITFDESLSVGEDILYILKIFLQNPKTIFLEDVCYHYVQHNSSVMHTVNPHLLEFLTIPKKLSATEITTLEQFPAEWDFFQLEMHTRTIHSISNSYKTNRKLAKKYLKQVYDKNTLKKVASTPFFPKSIRMEFIILKNLGLSFHLFLMPFYSLAKHIIR